MIPMHLVTREALASTCANLRLCMIAFHITNLYLDIAPTLGSLANDAGLVCITSTTTGCPGSTRCRQASLPLAGNGAQPGRSWSAGHRPALGRHARSAGTKVWTDDYSNLLRVIKWN